MRRSTSPRAAMGALLLTLLASCSLAPKYERPAAPVAGAYPAAPAGGADGAVAAAAADLGWRDVFADARLRALVELALQQNRDLRVAALNVELARAHYRIQRAALLPQVDGSASFARGRTPADQSSTGEPFTSSMWTVGAGVTAFELDLFGRVRNLKDAALESYLATEEARRSAHLALVGGVAEAYLTARALDEQADLSARTLALVKSSLELVRRRGEVGQASELELRTAEAQVETARADLAARRQQRAQAENALVFLVGQPLPAGLPAPAPLEEATLLADLPAGLPSTLLERRPDILSAEHALMAANANIGAARAAFFPSISLTAFGGLASGDLGRLFGGDAVTWSFSPRVNIPIFDGGRNKANLEAAKVQQAIGVAQYEQAIQAAFREVSDALAARAWLGDQLAAVRARVAAEERRYQLADLRFRKGIDPQLVSLTAQRDLNAAQQALVQVRLARLTSTVALYRALGGGWLERTAVAGTPATPVPAAGAR